MMANKRKKPGAGTKSNSVHNGGTSGGSTSGGSSGTVKKLQFGLPPAQSLIQLINNPYLSDVVFKVGQAGVLIYAHKLIITTASEVFYAQFNGHFMEARNDQKSAPVIVQDIEPGVFLEVLIYIYCERVNLNASNMLDIYYASHKYMLQSLSEKCEDAFERLTTEDNVLKVFQENQKHRFDNVDQQCLKIIRDNPIKHFKQDHFLKLSAEALLVIASQSTINCQEDHMRQAIETWKKQNGALDVAYNIKDVLCRKLHFFGSPYFQANIDTSLLLTVKSKIALYGLGVFVGVDQEIPPAGKVEIVIMCQGKQLASKSVPIHKNLQTHEIMFEKVIIDANCNIQVAIKKPDDLKELKMFHIKGFMLAGTLGKANIVCKQHSTQQCYICRYNPCYCQHNCVSYLMCEATHE
ncbi:BTB/POZ domain-containing protein 6 [Aedes aegypti]|uniref:Uncharacterized protein n=1 Tax=Aedes aegypti TaxID=7159 RepID=A0A6I8TBN8_AEDAE|nr:BTB/POZ domain-containing protein 6 [Aedes aegypti]